MEINDLNFQVSTAAEQQTSVMNEITNNMSNIAEIARQLQQQGMSIDKERSNLLESNQELEKSVSQFEF